MLTRPTPHLPTAATQMAPRRMPGMVRSALPASLQRWLSAPGSLTARLRLHGSVSVQVIRQGRLPLWPQERQALGCAQGHVREVVLRINGRPAIWARSSTPLRSVKGPWRAIKGLGTRPLAELLFEHRGVQRDRLQARRLARHSAERHHLVREWANLVPATHDAPPAWIRRSVFWHRGHPLQVQESFAPWVTGLYSGPRDRRHRRAR